LRLPFLAAVLAAAPPLLAAAADAADPSAIVPRIEYRSVFEGVTSGIDEETVDWKKANAEVGQFPRGHIDLLKWEAAQDAAAPAAPASAPAPARREAPRGHQH
jgi:hypothetical protein